MTEEARRELAPHGVLRAGINERNPALVSARARTAARTGWLRLWPPSWPGGWECR